MSTEQAQLQRLAAEKAANAAATERVQTWDRTMQRAFKGIMPRRTRHAFLQRATVPQESDDV